MDLVRFLLLILILFFSGCAPSLYWAKPGAQPGEFERDIIECRRTLGIRNTEGAVINPRALSMGTGEVPVQQCLANKGWYLAEKPDNEG